MKPSIAVFIVPALIPLTITGWSKVETVPIPQVTADAATSAYVGVFSAMHGAIPAGLGAVIDEYY